MAKKPPSPSYYAIDTMPLDTAFCFLKKVPAGFEENAFKLNEGLEVVDEDDYPRDPRVQMAAGYGRELGGIVGNTHSMLIVSRPMKDAVEALGVERLQVLPLAIYNHKKRLETRDYFILNPLGQWDCLDLDESEIQYDDDDVVGVDKFVLSAAKLEDAPDLFRVKEDPETYVASEALVRAWIGLSPRPQNVYVKELEISKGRKPARKK